MSKLGIYIHLPFCVHRCVYCDFNVTLFQNKSQLEDYQQALEKEISYYAKRLGTTKIVDSIFMGGGTPSLYEASQIESLISKIKHSFNVTDDVEITMEANPNSVSFEKLSALKKAGVNRLSLGVQSFSPQHLKTLERIHSKNEAIAAFEIARKAGFKSINLDFIFGIPNQTLEDFQNDIDLALTLNPEHLSTYHLTVTKKNRLYATLPLEEVSLNMYTGVISKLSQSHYHHYEVSAFSKEGFQSRHNLKYWKLENYLGLGVGSYSYIKDQGLWGSHFVNTPSLNSYIKSVGLEGHAVVESEPLDAVMAQKDYMLTNLRRIEGIQLADFEKRFGKTLMKSYSKPLSRLKQQDMVDLSSNMLKLKTKGLLYLNQVLLEFM